ncbi:MAG: GntR family transcriptional regulator [Chloroflexi bacterium]|nr:GntR family transcriptional regulator [Chloroflexota bacterium]
MVRLAHADALYERIAAEILRRVASGKLRPGDRLPPIRQAAGEWGVNLNTVARAYAALAERGILETRAGGGTVVARTSATSAADGLDPVSQARAERLQARLGSAVLEALAAGYAEAEIEAAVSAQLARWRATRVEESQGGVHEESQAADAEDALRLVGSHDLALEVLAGRLRALPDSVMLEVVPTDSLDGLFALARGTTDLAGCHLLDPETGDHNVSFVRRLLPGETVLLVTLAHRQQGLIVRPGNPRGIHGIADLARPGITIVNRHRGSGTRVLLDDALGRAHIDPLTLAGYDREEATHLAVAGAVAAGTADTGLGILAAARAYGLDFVPVARERYELALRPVTASLPAVQHVLETLRSADFRAVVTALGGYDTSESGVVRSVE